MKYRKVMGKLTFRYQNGHSKYLEQMHPTAKVACVAGGILSREKRAAKPRDFKAAPFHSPRDFAARIHSPLSKFYLAREQSRQLRRLRQKQKSLRRYMKGVHYRLQTFVWPGFHTSAAMIIGNHTQNSLKNYLQRNPGFSIKCVTRLIIFSHSTRK